MIRSSTDPRWRGLFIAGAAGARLVAAIGLALGAGLVVGVVEPRGPVTTAQAIVSMLVMVGLGIGLGYLTGTRWVVVLGPLGLAAGVEIMRLAIVGVGAPTVTLVAFGSMYGIIGFLVGRGISALLLLAPLAAGGLWGVELAARTHRPGVRRLGFVGLSAAVVGSLALAGLAVGIAQPASTAPIVGPDGRPVAGSVAELATVHLGGGDQVVMIRGRSADNPVLLYLAGGPGGTDLGAMRADTGLESDFVVATWDQRGTGKSYAAIDPEGTFTVDRMVSDTIELTDYLRDRFDEQRIYLVGNSWGSILGVLAVQRSPERYAAYVGTGQMVDVAETDLMFWEDSLAWARDTGQADLAATLETNGPPPYADLLDYEPALGHEHDWNPYPELNLDLEMPGTLFVPEYGLMDRINGFRGLLDTLAVLYPELQGLDFRADASQLDVPVYMVLGAHEARGRALPAREWLDTLRAPSKELVVFDHSGHRPQFEEPAEFASLMRRVATVTAASRAVGDTAGIEGGS